MEIYEKTLSLSASQSVIDLWAEMFVEFILLYEIVKNEVTGKHYCQVIATFTSKCNIDKNSDLRCNAGGARPIKVRNE